MYHIFVFILFLFTYNSKFDNLTFYSFCLFNPYYGIISIIFIREVKNIIALIIGLLNYFIRSKIIFTICIVLLILDNYYNIIIIPFILLAIDKKLNLKIPRLYYFIIYLLALFLNRNNVFLYLSFIFLIRIYDIKYSYIIAIISSFICNNIYISLFSILNPILYLLYLLPKSYININNFDISLYFSIIFYIIVLKSHNKNKYIIKSNINEYNEFLNSLDKNIFEEANYTYKNLEYMHNNVCKRCLNFKKCIADKYYIPYLKSVINNNYFNYMCINPSRLKKPYSKTFSYLPIINILKDISNSFNNEINNRLIKIYNILLILGVNLKSYEIIRGKKDDFLIKINSNNISHYKYLLKLFNIELIYNVYLTNKLRYKIYHHEFKYSKNNNPLTGDNFLINDYINGISFILSDGMGSGAHAYNESNLILNLINKLEFVPIQNRLLLINELCKLKCNFESYATLDYLYINKSNLDCYLYKMGSSNTYIIRDNDLTIIENYNAPLGFDKKIEKSKIQLFENDIIILTSDGLSDINGFSNIILKNINTNIQQMAYNIIKDSTSNLNIINDDISLIIIKIEKQ